MFMKLIVTLSKVNSMSTSKYSVYTNLFNHNWPHPLLTVNYLKHFQKYMPHLQLVMVYFCLN